MSCPEPSVTYAIWPQAATDNSRQINSAKGWTAERRLRNIIGAFSLFCIAGSFPNCDPMASRKPYRGEEKRVQDVPCRSYESPSTIARTSGASARVHGIMLLTILHIKR